MSFRNHEQPRKAASGYEGAMRPPPLVILGIVILVVVCVLAALAGSSVFDSMRRQMEGGRVGQIARGVEAMTPDIQRRDQEVKELTHP